MSYAKIRATKELLELLPKKVIKSLRIIEGEELEIRSKREKKGSIRELRGLGKELWMGVEIERYVRGERKAWEENLRI
ncbi:MAG: AbrB/MazE/SpoVT family DNA-binding domain-containing protein [Euryarchaeota archaeon]|nr:AbrB/MazE/SpoVT family DNA-binding domain-containing protein [Euryarchaeota archaeon]